MLLFMFAAFFNLLGAGCMISATVMRAWLHSNSAIGIIADFGLWDFCLKAHPTLANLSKVVAVGNTLWAFILSTMGDTDGCYAYENVPGPVYSMLFTREDHLLGLRILVISSALVAIGSAAFTYMAIGFQYTKMGLYLAPAGSVAAAMGAIGSIFLARTFWADTVGLFDKLVGRDYYCWYTSYVLMCIGAVSCLVAAYMSFVQVKRVIKNPRGHKLTLPLLNRPAGPASRGKKKSFW